MTPWFLAGGLAIVVPLWLHRLNRVNPMRQPFSSLMLMAQRERRTSLRRQLRYLLLLSLRIAFLLLLVLAFARPSIRHSVEPSGPQSPLHRVIVLDTSASMQYGQRWSLAVAAVEELLDSLEPGSRAMLATASSRFSLVENFTTSVEDLRGGLSKVTPGSGRLDFGGLMQTLRPLTDELEGGVDVHLVSDFQRSGLPVRFADLLAPFGGQIRFHNVAGSADSNWFIEHARVSLNTLQVGIRGWSTPEADFRVTLRVNEGELQAAGLKVPASGRGTVEFGLENLDPGANRLKLVLEAQDPLPVDNRYFLVINGIQERSVLVIGTETDTRSGLYLETALESAAQGFSVTRVNRDSAVVMDLAKNPNSFSLVAVADLGELTGSFINALGSYVAAGGQVIAALGPGAAQLETIPVTGQKIGSSSGFGQRSMAGRIDTTHPALQILPGLRDINFYRHVSLVPAPEDRILVSLNNGDPLLLESRLGNGRLLLLSTSLDNTWNDLPLRPVFVSLIGELAGYLTGQKDVDPMKSVGDFIETDGRTTAIAGPVGGTLDVIPGTPVRADHPGFYEIETLNGTRVVAANRHPEESLLELIPDQQLAAWGDSGVWQRNSGQAGSAVENESAEFPVWRWLLLALALAAVAEMVVSNRHLRIARQ